jgi:5-keto 4-deoxyuronate isomerase
MPLILKMSKTYDTARLRKEFLIENIFIAGWRYLLSIQCTIGLLSGGAMPVKN